MCACVPVRFHFEKILLSLIGSSSSNSNGSDGVDGGGSGTDGNIAVLYKHILWLCIAYTFKQSTDRTRTEYIAYKIANKMRKKATKEEWKRMKTPNAITLSAAAAAATTMFKLHQAKK